MSQYTSLLLRRSFSTGGLVSQLAKTPVQVFGIEGRYATALYSAATKTKKLENVESELKSVKKLYDENAKFKEMVLNPSFKRQDKRAVMVEILKKLGHSDVTVNFFDVVSENGRLGKLEGIVKSFEEIMRAHRGEVSCEVITAKPLDGALTKELNVALQAFTKQGEKLNVTTKVDPSLIGGIIVKIGDKFVDMSISSKMKHYEKLLHEAV